MPARARRLVAIAAGLLGLLALPPAAAANPIGDLWDWGSGLVGDAAGGVAGDGIRALTSWVADGAGWLSVRCFEAMGETSDPRPGEAWFDETYLRMTLIGASLAGPCLVLGLIQAVMQQDGRMLGRVLAAVPGSVLLTGAAVAVARMLLVATDQMSLWLIEASGRDVGAYGARMAALLSASPGTSAFVVFLISFLAAVCALVLWLELLVRAALVYVLLAFFPVMAALMIWPASAGGVRRLVRLLVAVILSKVVIVAVVAMGVAAATESGASDRFEGLLVGTAMVGIACFAPMAIHRLLPLLEDAVHVRGNVSAGGGMRQGQSAAMTASSTTSVVRQLQSARVGGGAEPGVAGAGPARVNGGGSVMPIAGRSDERDHAARARPLPVRATREPRPDRRGPGFAVPRDPRDRRRGARRALRPPRQACAARPRAASRGGRNRPRADPRTRRPRLAAPRRRVRPAASLDRPRVAPAISPSWNAE